MAIFLSNMVLPMLDASCHVFSILRPLVTSLVSFSKMALPTTDLNTVDGHFPIQHGTPHVGCFLSFLFTLRPLVTSLVSFSNMVLPTTYLNIVDAHFPIQHGTPHVGCFLSFLFYFAASGHVSG